MSRSTRRPLVPPAKWVLLGAACLLSTQAARCDVADTNALASPDVAEPWRNIEVKRQFTDHGTEEENSRTTIRLEAFPRAFITQVRLDIPFIDEKNGDPTTSHLGDIRLRFGLPSWSLGETTLSTFEETTFPSASPSSLGTGKYQLSFGERLSVPILKANGERAANMSFEPLAQPVFSVAGDQSRSDLNYTRFELRLRTAWRKKFVLDLTPKIIVDWKNDAETGGVLELEGGWQITRHWRAGLTLGHGLWGVGVPATYGSKSELSLRFSF